MRLKMSSHDARAAREAELALTRAASYASWRSACRGVAEAYQTWARAARTERWLAHAAYVAALDREERAACVYRQLIEQLRGTAQGGPSTAHAVSPQHAL